MAEQSRRLSTHGPLLYSCSLKYLTTCVLYFTRHTNGLSHLLISEDTRLGDECAWSEFWSKQLFLSRFFWRRQFKLVSCLRSGSFSLMLACWLKRDCGYCTVAVTCFTGECWVRSGYREDMMRYILGEVMQLNSHILFF